MADLPYSPDGFPLISNLADPLLPPRLPDDVTAGWMDDLEYDMLEIPYNRKTGYPHFQGEVPAEWISDIDPSQLRLYLDSLP